jgi:DNA-binding transcriptional regulator YiaG
MLGVWATRARSWESGQRKPAPIAGRLLELIHANPWMQRDLVEAG